MELYGNEPRHPFTKEGIAEKAEELPGMYILESKKTDESNYEICRIGSSASNVRGDLTNLYDKLGLPWANDPHDYYYRLVHFQEDPSTLSSYAGLLDQYKREHGNEEPQWQHYPSMPNLQEKVDSRGILAKIWGYFCK